MARVLVIGAGMGGMACAARLASKGHQVRVVEQRNSFGGKVATISGASTDFEIGPNLLRFPAVYRDLFLKTGKPLEDSIHLIDSDKTFQYRFADGSQLTLPAVGVGKCAEAIGDAFGGKSAEEWRAFIRRGSQMWAAVRKPVFEDDHSGYRGLLELLKKPGTAKLVAPSSSLRKLSESYFSDPRLVALVDRYALEVGSDPRKASALLATQPYLEQTLGAYQVEGGMTKLSEALYQRCLELGVQFQFDTRIERLAGEPILTSAETANGEIIPADIFVANVALSTINAPSQVSRKTSSGLSSFTLLLETNLPKNEFDSSFELGTSTYLIPRNSNDEYQTIFGKPGQSLFRTDHTIKLALQSSSAENLALTVQVAVPPLTDQHRTFWKSAANSQDLRTQILNTVSSYGLELSKHISWEHQITPHDYESLTDSPAGSHYPTADTGIRSRFSRTPNTTSTSNLFIVGASAHPGGGLPEVGISAELVANKIGRSE